MAWKAPLGSRIHAILRVSYLSEHPSVMCPGHTPVPGIHVLLNLGKQDVDGRDKPGHDGVMRISPTPRLP